MATLKDVGLLNVGHSLQLVGALYADADKTYMVPFPEKSEIPSEVDTLSMDLDDWTTFLRQTDLLETEVLAQAKDGSLVKAIMRKSQRQVSQVVSWEVFRRDGYSCRYCANDKTPLTVDHLVLWEEGGPSIVANLLSACRNCNKTRGNMQYAAWLRSNYYARVSRGLSDEIRHSNEVLVGTLDSIPRMKHTPSHR